MKAHIRFISFGLILGLLLTAYVPAFAQNRGSVHSLVRSVTKDVASHLPLVRPKKPNLTVLPIAYPYSQPSLRTTSKMSEVTTNQVDLSHLPQVQNLLSYPMAQKYMRSIFRVLPASGNNSFTGTVLKTTYNGKEEIYGVIASHALSGVPVDEATRFLANKTVGRTFELEIYDENGQPVKLKADVVQMGAADMLDISLVKFRPEDEKKLVPLALNIQPVSKTEKLYSQGFGTDNILIFSDRRLLEKTELSLRLNITGDREWRRGFCGSPVINEQGEVVAIHTGSKIIYKGLHKQEIGYAIESRYLQLLVESYHNNGWVVFPLMFHDHEIAHLRVDEFVSVITLFDKNGNEILSTEELGRFSYSMLEKLFKKFSPRFIGLKIGRMQWTADGRFVEYSPTERHEIYDFQTRQEIDSL
ncbi:MAG: serine protease [Elusimicrobiaceae bacterium]|nr:serine protease [Elusimicrobiaceae bacterium]